MFFIAALAAMAVAGAEAAPSAPAPAPQEKAASAAKPKTKKVCTTMEVTGNRLPQKHCVTVKVPDEEPAATAEGQAEAPKS